MNAEAVAERERTRSQRARLVRSSTENTARATRAAVAAMRVDSDGLDDEFDARPRTRGECSLAAGGERPCPWSGCRHHLAIDVDEHTGSIKTNFPDLDPLDIPESCSLDVADRGPLQLEHVGALLNVTRERVRQLESIAMARVRRLAPRMRLDVTP